VTKRKKYGKKGHGGEKSHEFFRRFIMRRPVTLLPKGDKRKIALSVIEDFIQSVKNEGVYVKTCGENFMGKAPT